MNKKRKTLQKIAGTGAVAAVVPYSWIKPVVGSVMLPAHAQTSVDTGAPIIVVDTTPITITVGDTLFPPRATCTDDVDTVCAFLVTDVSGVDVNTAGSYEIVYRANDRDGNIAEVRVPVIVVDM